MRSNDDKGLSMAEKQARRDKRRRKNGGQRSAGKGSNKHTRKTWRSEHQ